jgi:hypothetical protein
MKTEAGPSIEIDRYGFISSLIKRGATFEEIVADIPLWVGTPPSVEELKHWYDEETRRRKNLGKE